MLGWLRRRREVRAIERAEAHHLLDLFGFEEAWTVLVFAMEQTTRRCAWDEHGRYTRLQKEVEREWRRRSKARSPRCADSAPQLRPKVNLAPLECSTTGNACAELLRWPARPPLSVQQP